MLEKVRRKMAALQMLANGDDRYYAMLLRLRELEKEYDAVIRELPAEQQDTVWEFAAQCEAMSHRMLEIACENMDFK